MKISKFEDIEAWKEARRLVAAIYQVFDRCKDYGFKDQIQRAAVSVMSNIAEGFDRGTNKEFIQYLMFARGSAAEVRSLLYAALDTRYIDDKQFDQLAKQCLATSGLINGFIRYLKKQK